MAITRSVYTELLKQSRDLDAVKIITGIRQCGKSTLLNTLYYEDLLSEGIPQDHIIRINFESLEYAQYTTNYDKLYQ